MATNFYRISPDQNRIFTGRQEYVFKPSKRKAFCQYCDISKQCIAIDNETGQTVFPCQSEQRTDGKDGIFKLSPSAEDLFFRQLGIIAIVFIAGMVFLYFS